MKRRWLVIDPGTPSERIVILDKAVTQLGRSEQCAVRLDSRNVSSQHASLVLRESGADLIDLDSTNGTTVNARRTTSTDLRDGDRVEMADVRMVFREEEVADEPAQRPRTETYFPAATLDTRRLSELLGRLAKQGEMSADEAQQTAQSVEMLTASARRLDALYAVLDNAVRAGERTELVRTILREIGGLLSLDVIGLYLRDDAVFWIWENGELSTESRTDTVSATLLDTVLSSGAPQMVENVGADNSVLGFESLVRLRIQSVLCLPVLPRNGAAIGALYCVSRSSGELRLLEKDRLFLSACSSVIATGLESLAQLSRTADMARAQERNSLQRRYSPVIRRLADERESLSLRLHGFRSAPLHGLERATSAPLRAFVERAARSDVPVLMLGETGVGKTMIARYIHEQGRSGAPFVTVDCTTLSAELVESELFGHEKGAFTGAYARKEGKVAAAGNGTVLIDEVGDLPPRLQGKLLRLIESGEFEPVGSTRTQHCAARLVFATNRDLEREIDAGTFRKDLYYRLNVLSHRIAPLRERRELIVPLAEHFLAVYASHTGAVAVSFSRPALDALGAHPWPGNVRELENAVMRALIRTGGGVIDAADLELTEHTPPQTVEREIAPEQGDESRGLDLKQARERVDRDYIQRALAASRGNVSQAARLLNLSRNALMELVKKYGLT